MDAQLQSVAQQALDAMRAAGFHHAQVTASTSALDELNVADNEPALLRSTQTQKVALLGIVDGRMASTEVTSFAGDALRESAASLFADALAAPQDDANAVSSAQTARIEQGPQEGDRDQLSGAMRDLLTWRKSETPLMVLSEAAASHTLSRWHTLTTGGSDLAGSMGWYSLSGFGTARDGAQSSSFNYTGGSAHTLQGKPAHEQFGIGAMMRDTVRQIRTQPLGAKFVGDVVLMPNAVDDLLAWLLAQISDMQLIAGTSLYRDKVGQRIASPKLTIRGEFDMPGVAAQSSDAFAVRNVTLVEQGVLHTLTPTLYGSRKTGVAHVPVAGRGWDIAAGDVPLADLIGGVQKGALVGRLSMGVPAANGNFSAVIKNSFRIDKGEVGPALAECMIAGNMARMLQDIVAASRETLEGDGTRRPWLRVANLHFS